MSVSDAVIAVRVYEADLKDEHRDLDSPAEHVEEYYRTHLEWTAPRQMAASTLRSRVQDAGGVRGWEVDHIVKHLMHEQFGTFITGKGRRQREREEFRHEVLAPIPHERPRYSVVFESKRLRFISIPGRGVHKQSKSTGQFVRLSRADRRKVRRLKGR
jgi:hypothetical protein